MRFRVTFNIILILAILYGFFAVWRFNQRVNYQKVFTLDTKFTFTANSLKSYELFSPTKVLLYLKNNGFNVSLDPVMKMSSQYEALGRTLNTDYGQIEVYEYEQPKKAEKKLSELMEEEKSGFVTSNLYTYKNLIIANVSGSDDLNQVISDLIYEK